MKAIINKNGLLIVKSESENEDYPLRKWWEGFSIGSTQCESSMGVKYSDEDESE